MLLLALLVITSNAYAQLNSASGRVFDKEDGQPIIGATVRVDGTNTAVATDEQGTFSLSGLKSDAQITVSYIGYLSQTLPAKTGMKIYLEPKAELMDEVIVVAFGKQKRESFTGSASVVSAAEITRQQVSNPLDALNGRVTGLNMTETNSFSSDSKISIRGYSSINASNEPLIVLDGLPYNGYLHDINPADIQSMTVLKDAASNALYGARGANGVILITTKDAQRGQTKVTVDAKWGVNHDARVEYDYIDNPGEYYEAHYLAMRNYYQYSQGYSRDMSHIKANQNIASSSGQGGVGYMVYTVPENQFLIGNNGRLNPAAVLGNRVAYDNKFYTLMPDDWTEAGLHDGFRQEYNINISGGNEKYTMMASMGYLNDEGIAIGSSIERFSARIKANYQAYSFLRIGANAGYTHTDTDAANLVFGTRYSVAPIYPLYIRDGNGTILTDRNGRRYDYGAGDNAGLARPVEVSGNSIQDDILNIDNNNSNAFNIQGFATVDFLKHFHFTANGSAYITENRMKYATNPYYGFYLSTGGYTQVSHYRTMDTNFQQLLNFNYATGNHSIDALLGHEYSRTEQTRVIASRNKIANYGHNTEVSGAITNASMSSRRSLYNVEGYFLRAQYDYSNRYFASASFRRDGSSRFHPDHRWGNFWSLGAAWILSKEEWFPKNDKINMLKAKISYGEQGNDGIDNFLYTDLYSIRNSNDEPAFVFSSKGNEDITWETVGSLNAGIEFELFNSRLRGGLEFYTRTTKDMLMHFSAPYEIGYSGYYDNIGDMNNKGLELELSADIIKTRNFNWNLALNLTWQKNKVSYLPEDKKGKIVDGHPGYVDEDLFYTEGLPVYTWYMKRYAGVNDKGQALYYKNSDDGLTTTTRYDSADYFLCGSPLPDVFGGFTSTFNIFGVDISAMFNYSIGGKKWDYGYQQLMTAPRIGYTGRGLHRDIFNAWSEENLDSNIPMWRLGDEYAGSLTDRYLIDGSYLTFRNLTVGYTFPKNITNRLKMAQLRIFAVCENVAYWTKRKGFDPRQSVMYGDYGTGYSPMRTISGGLQVQF